MNSMRQFIVLLLIFILVLPVGVALAQQEIPIQSGVPAQGEIASADEQDVFLYEGFAGETVEINVVALPESTLDTVLELYDSTNTQIAFNDDRAPGDSNSTIIYFFETDATYRIVVRGYGSVSTGAYEIVVGASQSTVENDPNTAPPNVLRLDEPTSDAIETGEFDTWTFTPETDGIYRLLLDSADFDAELRVLSASGMEIAFDDDSGPELNAFISQIEMLGGQTYTIEARSYLDEGAGNYQISVTVAPETPPAVTIKYGDTLEAELVEGVPTTFVFEAAANDVISVAVQSASGFDAYVEVLDADGILIGADDDSGGELQPLIRALTIPESGTYTILVTGYNSYDAGPFTITLATVDVSDLPDNQTITYGETVSGFKPAGLDVTFIFTGAAGDSITVEVDSSFDGYLELRTSTGEILASDDDSGFDLNPLLENVELPADGEYTLVLSGFSDEATGDFTLRLISGNVAVPTGTMVYGETVEGNLVGGEIISYSFDGTSGDIISVAVETEFDSYLELKNAAGEVIFSDDDSGGSLQPAITEFTLPETGLYELELSGFSTFDEGPYTITLTAGEGGVTFDPGEATPISYGETVTTAIDSGNTAALSFSGTEGDVVTISMDAPFDGLMELYDSTGQRLTSDDDSGGNLNPRIENFTLPATGDYRIVISAFGGVSSGEFTVTLATGENGEQTDPQGTDTIDYASATPIQYATPTQGNLEGAGVVYRFTAAAGDTITVAAEADFDGLLELRSEDGTLLTQDDDSGTGLNPLIEGFVLENAGDYLIVLTSFGETGRGAYTLTVSVGEALPTTTVIEAGQTLTQPLATEGASVFAFNAEAEQTISLAAAPLTLDSDLDLYIEILSPTGELIAADDDSGWRFNPALVGVELPESGTYQINVQSFSGTAGDFSLSVAEGAVYLASDGQPAETLPFDGEQANLSLNLAAGEARQFIFEATQGNILNITSSNPAIGVEIFASDGSDQILSEGELLIPADSTYVLVVYAAEATNGDVQIALFEDIAVEPVKTAGGLLAPDTPVQDTLARGEQKQWTFAPVLTGTYTFVLNSEDAAGKFDPYLVVLDTEGNLLAQDDDSGGNFNPLIANFAVTGGSKVILEVRGFDNNSAGDYLLAVVTDSVAEVSTLDGGEMGVGDVRLNQLLPGQQAEFSLTLAETQTVNITLDGLTLAYVDVLNESGELVTRGTGGVKTLELTAGTYTLVVYDRLNRAGNFSVRVSPAE